MPRLAVDDCAGNLMAISAECVGKMMATSCEQDEVVWIKCAGKISPSPHFRPNSRYLHQGDIKLFQKTIKSSLSKIKGKIIIIERNLDLQLLKL